MTLEDLPAVMLLEQAAYSAPWPEAAYRQALSNDQALFVLLRYQGKIVGYSGMWHLEDAAHVGTIVSHSAARRKGVGELLLVIILQQARTLPVDVVTLEVRPSNEAAKSLYAKYGFVLAGRRRNYYPDTGEDGLIMTTPSLELATYQAFLQSLEAGLVERLASFHVDGLLKLT
jgi:ribosomal-protein-alanine N-acetyltransferase